MVKRRVDYQICVDLGSELVHHELLGHQKTLTIKRTLYYSNDIDMLYINRIISVSTIFVFERGVIYIAKI